MVLAAYLRKYPVFAVHAPLEPALLDSPPWADVLKNSSSASSSSFARGSMRLLTKPAEPDRVIVLLHELPSAAGAGTPQ
jgi:hypothetical protein